MPQSFENRPISRRYLGGIGKDPALTEKRYLAQRRLKGVGEAVLGLPDLVNMALNAGIRDVGYFAGMKPDDVYQLPMASQAAANLLSPLAKSGIVSDEEVTPEARQKGANQQALFGMLPTGVEDVPQLASMAAIHAVPPLIKAAKRLGAPAEELPKVVKGLGKLAKTGRAEAITAVDLRAMSLPDAIQYAKGGEYLKPKPEGGYVGAPAWVKDEADLAKMRAHFDELVEGGASGADWYERVHSWVKRMTPDPVEQRQLVDELALFSAQSEPDTNLAFALQARNARLAGTPAAKVRTGQQAKSYMEAYTNPARMGRVKLGKKTAVYAKHMDPTQLVTPTTGTNDIWHARSFGYINPKTGKPWSAALTPQQHAFMDAETVLAVDRANARKLGGRSDWTAGEIQAAPWVGGKGRGLAERKFYTKSGKYRMQGPLSPQEIAAGVEEAKKTYPDFEQKYTIQATHETTPGATGHLPALQAADYATKERYGDLPYSKWARPEDQRDLLYASQHMLTAPSEGYQGLFDNQFSPGEIARPLGPPEGPSGYRVMQQPTRKLVTAAEALRAWTDAQQAGASSFLIPGQRMSHSNAYAIKLPVGMDTKEAMTLAESLGQKFGMPNVVHHGGLGAVLTDFSGDPHFSKAKVKGVDQMPAIQIGDEVFTGKTIGDARKAAKAAGAKGKAVEGFAKPPGIGRMQSKAAKQTLAQGLGAEGVPVRMESTYEPFDWSKPGSDTATLAMLDKVSGLESGLDTPRVRAHVLGKMQQDMDYAAQTGQPVRKDIQFARDLFAREGFQGLREAVGKGLLPVAAVGIFLQYAGQDQGDGTT